MNTEILNIINHVESEAFWLLLKLILAGIILLVIKALVEKIVAYLLFRWNKNLGKGVRVFIQGQQGEIKDYNLSCIFIHTQDRIIIVNMRRWVFEKIALVKDNEKI